MKRAIAIFFVILYTVSVSGMVIQHHYCDGSLMASGLAGTVDDCCMMDEKKSDGPCEMDCCLTKSEIVKVDASQEQPSGYKVVKIETTPLIVSTSFNCEYLSLGENRNLVSENLHPPKIPLRILHSVFRL